MPLESPFFLDDEGSYPDRGQRIYSHSATWQSYMTSAYSNLSYNNHYGLDPDDSLKQWSPDNYWPQYIPDLKHVDDNHISLASIVYGEASPYHVFDEMNSIAIADVRHMEGAHTHDVARFHDANKGYSYAWGHEKAQRLKDFFHETIRELWRRSAYQMSPRILYTSEQNAMLMALDAAYNALSNNPIDDKTGGAQFWQGVDFITQVSKHKGPVVGSGYHITNQEHADTFNKYLNDHTNIKARLIVDNAHTELPALINGKPNPKLQHVGRKSFTYVYESTAAFGGTIFFRYAPDYAEAIEKRNNNKK